MKKEENGESELVGHVAKEVSRFVYKWMSKAGAVEVMVYDSFLGNKNVKQKSFRAFGLEIGYVLTFEAEDAKHQNLLRRHFLRMKHKRDMCQKLIGTYYFVVRDKKVPELDFSGLDFDNYFPLIDVLDFNPGVEDSMLSIFRESFICRNPETAEKLRAERGYQCATMNLQKLTTLNGF